MSAKPKAVRKRKLRPRKAFAFNTKEAELYLIEFKGKIRAIRTAPDKNIAKKDYREHSMFHILHPKVSLKPVGVHYVVDKDGKKRWGMVSEIIRGRSRDYTTFHKDFYTNVHWQGGDPLYPEAGRRHYNFAHDVTKSIVPKLLSQGITPQIFPANVINANGIPKFVEIANMDPLLLKKTISAVRGDQKRRKLRRHYNLWKKLEMSK